MKTLVRFITVYINFQKTKVKISVNFLMRKYHFHIKTFNFFRNPKFDFLRKCTQKLFNIFIFLKVNIFFCKPSCLWAFNIWDNHIKLCSCIPEISPIAKTNFYKIRIFNKIYKTSFNFSLEDTSFLLSRRESNGPRVCRLCAIKICPKSKIQFKILGRLLLHKVGRLSVP